ncbi:MAM and LDL-receptor class A domain-containing protein 2-like [Anneissia japonica]|uniref:MAM and LDL-receptor class A domain-containing protein 2-like n=1 Tax=Anneissia japonica TaxID=1529436 RepID=UPI0014259186|nr:MAM and LDL-receptor class A domain-containing protein 2-like [Anneissia japonica]
MKGDPIGTLRVYLDEQYYLLVPWQISGDQGDRWNLASAPLGRITGTFRVWIQAERSFDTLGDIAIDDISFSRCALPAVGDGTCSSNQFLCTRQACIDETHVCDFSDDCGDYSDEASSLCTNYDRCNFERGFCDWTQLKTDEFDWSRTRGVSDDGLATGPLRDHTVGTSSGFYLYTDASSPRVKGDRAKLASPIYKRVQNPGNCHFRFWFHMYGENIDTLNVYSRNAVNGPVTLLWSRSGHVGDYWERVDLDLRSNNDFQIVFEGIRGNGPNGDIAIDDTSFTPGCQRASGSLPIMTTLAVPTGPTIGPCGSGRWQCGSGECIFTGQICDWNVDCSDKSDEAVCGPCDFESGMCGYADVSTGYYEWQFQLGGDTEAPSTDHTTGSFSGHYMKVAPGNGIFMASAYLRSPVLPGSSEDCMLTFWYIYSVTTDDFEFNIQVLDASDVSNSYYVWYPVGKTGTVWQKASVGLGRINMNFMTSFEGYLGDVIDIIAVDDITYEGCSLGDFVGPCEFQCSNGLYCLPNSFLCDYSDDCGDKSDEQSCAAYIERCDFETELCNWSQDSDDDFDWTWISGEVGGQGEAPDVDHTTNTPYGKYLYLETEFSNTDEKARLSSKVFDPVPSEKSCLMRFYYHMYGSNVNRLTVYKRTSQTDFPTSMWSMTGSQGDAWLRAEVDFTMGTKFQVVIEGVGGPGRFEDDIAIDDISFTPDCSLDPTNTLPITITPTSGPNCTAGYQPCKNGTCLPYTDFCDFKHDCYDGSDEEECPSTCSFESGLCGWSQVDSDDFDWSIKDGTPPKDFNGPVNDHTYNSPKGVYLYVDGTTTRPDQRAKLISPLYRLAGLECEFSFWYYMFGVEYGDLETYIKTTDKDRQLAKVSDGLPDYNVWQKEVVKIDQCTRDFQIYIDAEDRLVASISNGFAIDDIRFDNCAYKLPPEIGQCLTDERQCSSGHCYPLSAKCDFKPDCCDETDEQNCQDYHQCNFESNMCDWEQLTSDEFDWTRHQGSTGSSSTGPDRDHTLDSSSGWYLYIETSSPRLNGDRAKIASYVIDKIVHCSLRFWYHMRGDHIGTLNVYTRTMVNGPMNLEWSMGEDKGNSWHFASIVVNSRTEDFQFVIEGVRGSEYQGDISLDDISFTPDCEPAAEDLPVMTTPVPTKITTMPDVCRNPLKFQCRDYTCIDKEQRCDFKTQCPDRSDELGCPTSCTFEDDMCGYVEQTDDKFDWHRANGLDTVSTPGVAPRNDHTTSGNRGYYLYVAPYGQTSLDQVADIVGPQYTSASDDCRISFWYIITGTNTGSLKLSILDPESFDETLLFYERTGRGSEWVQMTVGLGRRKDPYRLRFSKERNINYQGIIALDDVEFFNCHLPDPVPSCDTTKYFWCDNKACIDKNKVCDLADNCGDGSDEKLQMCTTSLYKRCDFDKDFCDWTQAEETDEFDWLRNNGPTNSIDSGPSRDHTTGTSKGFYVYIDPAINQNYLEAAELLSRKFQGVVLSGDCKMRFFYHMFGDHISTLSVSTRIYKDSNRNEQLEWSLSGSQGDFWERAEVTLSRTIDFKVVIRADVGDQVQGDIAIDDVTFTPGCVPSTGDLPNTPPTVPSLRTTPTPTQHPSCTPSETFCTPDNKCIPPTLQCDFKNDCSDGSDELMCVSTFCDFETDFCGWEVSNSMKRDTVSFVFVRGQGASATDDDYRPGTDHTLGTPLGYYLYADGSPGDRGDTAYIGSPIIQRTGTECILEFYYVVSGANVGSLRVYTVFDLDFKERWFIGGSQGSDWQKAEVFIGAEIEIRVVIGATRGATFRGDYTVDDIKFINCAPPEITGDACKSTEFHCSNDYCVDYNKVCDYNNDCGDNSDESHCTAYPGRCDFELNLCSWHQELDDQFDWTLRTGSTGTIGTGPTNDHTLKSNNGHYIYIDTSWPRQENDVARLGSPTFSALTGSKCRVRLWYHMNGPEVGMLSVYRRTSYTSSNGLVQIYHLIGAQGDYWKLLDVAVGEVGVAFEIVLEGVKGSGNQGDIAIDDVSFTTDCITGGEVPGSPHYNDTNLYCSDGRFACATGNQCYETSRRCDFIYDCSDGSDEKSCGTTCDFEYGMCGWQNSKSDNGDWTMGQGSSSRLNTGPEEDHNPGTKLGHYLYIDTSTLIDNANNEKAQLQTLPYHHSSSKCSLSLWYHMLGSSIGTLNVYLKTDSSSSKLFSVSGDQGEDWKTTGNIEIGHQEDFVVIIEAIRGVTITGDIAIDDILFASCPVANYIGDCRSDEFTCKDGTCVDLDHVCDLGNDCAGGEDEDDCPLHEGDCTFESPFEQSCSWIQLEGDQSDWSQGKTTPTQGTGPDSDHTPSSNGGSFLYASSVDLQKGDLTWVATPSFPASKNSCIMRFWYSMNGPDMGGLRLYTMAVDNGFKLLQWELVGNQGDGWKYGKINIDNNQEYRVVFEAITGYGELSDIAIDDVTFTAGCRDPDALLPTHYPGPCDWNHFFCPRDQVCIPLDWVCDGKVDCPGDLADEPADISNCPNNTRSTEEPFNGNNEAVFIAIGVVAAILLVIILILVAYMILKRKQQKRFGDITKIGKPGLDNPVYGTESFGEPLTDFAMSDVDTSMFVGEPYTPAASSSSSSKTGFDNVLYGEAGNVKKMNDDETLA